MTHYDITIKDGFGYRFLWIGSADNIADAIKTAMQGAAMSGGLSSDITRDRWPTLPVTISVSEVP